MLLALTANFVRNLRDTFSHVRVEAEGTAGKNSQSVSVSGTGDVKAANSVGLNLLSPQLSGRGGVSLDLFPAPPNSQATTVEVGTPRLGPFGGVSFELAMGGKSRWPITLTSVGLFGGVGVTPPASSLFSIVDVEVQVADFAHLHAGPGCADVVCRGNK